VEIKIKLIIQPTTVSVILYLEETISMMEI